MLYVLNGVNSFAFVCVMLAMPDSEDWVFSQQTRSVERYSEHGGLGACFSSLGIGHNGKRRLEN